ncbi:MAG: YibE/F family protein [Pygmaiobacter massiliensis]|nr:YibE/F family protein [Pygmaiobacter massiliensis]
MLHRFRNRQFLCYWATLLCSILLLILGNRLAHATGVTLPPFSDPSFFTARVLSITDEQIIEQPGFGDGDAVYLTERHFIATALSGTLDGRTLYAVQQLDSYQPVQPAPVEEGDLVLLYPNPDPSSSVPFLFSDYQRSKGIGIFCVIFLGLLLVFGRKKGFNTIVALIFTCGAVFLVFLPWVLAGANIYLCAILICIYVVASTLLLVDGLSAKTLVAICGCAAGVLTAAALAVLLSQILKLSGLTSQESIFLSQLAVPIDLLGVVFAGIIIGAMGAVMDVAMSVASALSELHEKARDASFRSLFSSGIQIGRDMMSTMANTLVLAYIGSSLTSVLLLTTYASSVFQLLNLEMIVTEILQAIIGSMAILLTIPITSLIAARVYSRLGQNSPENAPALPPNADEGPAGSQP